MGERMTDDHVNRRSFMAASIGLLVGLVTRGFVSEEDRLLEEWMARSRRMLDELETLELDVERMRADMIRLTET